jgi:Zn-dependent protease with chaperone function
LKSRPVDVADAEGSRKRFVSQLFNLELETGNVELFYLGSMPTISPDTVPYPPGPDPDAVPEGLTATHRSYRTQELLLLGSQLLFLAVYVSLIAGSLGIAVTLGLSIAGSSLADRILAGLGILMLVSLAFILVKAFFRKKEPYEKDFTIEVTAEDQPSLFAFIQRVCDDTGAEFPRKVFLTWDVNAMVVPQVTAASIFFPPRKDLYIGLGLVNAINLGEFQAVLAHEFGHFVQREHVAAYGRVIDSIIINILTGQDGLDRIFAEWGAAGQVLNALPRAVSWLLLKLHAAFSLTRHQLWREREFHADLVAASVAGSNAATHGLLKAEFGSITFHQALEDLKKAADQRRFTADIYFHQHAAASIVRRLRKKPALGVPPAMGSPIDGAHLRIFNPDDEKDHPADDYHPPNSEREKNIKKRFVPAVDDNRTPWLIFDDAAAVRRKLTHQVYRTWQNVPKNASLENPRQVQTFIDAEHSETTYDARYGGVYDGRPIRPGDISELIAGLRKEPWDDARIRSVHAKLLDNVEDLVKKRQTLAEEKQKLLDTAKGEPGRRAVRKIEDLDERIERVDESFQSMDRRAFLVHVQMAARQSEARYHDLVNRYLFHLTIQDMYFKALHHFEQALLYNNIGLAFGGRLDADLFDTLVGVMRDARASLKKMITEARVLDMPAMANFDLRDRLANFLLDDDVRDLPGGSVSGEWVGRLLNQLDQVRGKAARLHFKSLGGILKLQEQIAAEFLRTATPATAAAGA